MKNYLATAMALALVASTVGLATLPTAVAGHNDCHEDYEINAVPQARMLSGNGEEIGLSEVLFVGDESMTVTLASNDDKLEFTIRERIGGICSDSTNVSSNCTGPVELNTTGSATTDSIDCTLFAPTSGVRNFYVDGVNLESDSLIYVVDSGPV